mmetsp:Transcript_3043/g.9185  ORF Transcript_3043/g.9185 Transcript_3043/m.9185 type:complete len:165 (+) Transcript_3043:120-614(+)
MSKERTNANLAICVVTLTGTLLETDAPGPNLQNHANNSIDHQRLHQALPLASNVEASSPQGATASSSGVLVANPVSHTTLCMIAASSCAAAEPSPCLLAKYLAASATLVLPNTSICGGEGTSAPCCTLKPSPNGSIPKDLGKALCSACEMARGLLSVIAGANGP